MRDLVPGGSEGELTFHSISNMEAVMHVLLDEGYVVMVSQEESLYIINYIWSQEDYADRSSVVFMDRCNFETNYMEVDDEEEDEWQHEYKVEREKKDAANSAWHLAQKLMRLSSGQIEEVFGISEADDEAKDRFWLSFPDHLSYDVARSMFDTWHRKQMADVEDEVLNSAMQHWDRMNAEEAEEKMECDTTTYANALNDTLPSA